MNLDQYEAWAKQGMLRQAESSELIALVRRQESELAAQRDINEKLAVVQVGLVAALENSIALADRNRNAMLLLGHKVERPPEMQAAYDKCVAAVAAAKVTL